jgi:MoaA/NifB/PqqE/SkfB family radical SAM enzyme
VQSKYHQKKRQAFASFFDFAHGRTMPAWPLELFIEVSNVCDLKCAMCPTFSALNPERFVNLSYKDRGLINLQEDLTPLEQILEYTPLVHAHGYGEPTIHPQFREFIAYLTQFEVLIDFFTNGMHLQNELCEFLVEKRISRITVSISGVTKEDYENVYIGGKYETLLRGLANLRNAKEKAQSNFPRIDVNSVGFKHHVQRFPEFVRLMGEHGVNNINLKPLNVYETIKELHPHRAIMGVDVDASVIADARAVAKEYGMSLSIAPFENQLSAPNLARADSDPADVIGISELKNVSRETVMLDKTVSKRNRLRHMTTGGEVDIGNAVPCLEPFTTMNAKFSGEVYPCCFASSATGLTNIKRDPQGPVWNCDGYITMRDRALADMYPRGACGPCISRSSYPKHHNVDTIVRNYSHWFLKSFGVPFHSSIQQQSRRLPSNREIVDTWSAIRLSRSEN